MIKRALLQSNFIYKNNQWAEFHPRAMVCHILTHCINQAEHLPLNSIVLLIKISPHILISIAFPPLVYHPTLVKVLITEISPHARGYLCLASDGGLIARWVVNHSALRFHLNPHFLGLPWHWLHWLSFLGNRLRWRLVWRILIRKATVGGKGKKIE